ncbi:ATP-grasp domain-containing protein [Leptolyngbya sp. AN02str]|uniref:ATP-grasp domain-containing protein n=1 Tax=Leptolyngbya sp. AN02str TaxID=3423363 RepID=UPI003D310642
MMAVCLDGWCADGDRSFTIVAVGHCMSVGSALSIAMIVLAPTDPSSSQQLVLAIAHHFHISVHAVDQPLPLGKRGTAMLCFGSTLSCADYQQRYDVAQQQGLHLLNNAAQHQLAQEFDRAYPYLAHLTPQSWVVSEMEELESILPQLRFPVFVRGAVGALRAQGWLACVATGPQELRTRVAVLLGELTSWSRDRAIVRELVPIYGAELEFWNPEVTRWPMGREFRVVCYHQQPLSYGYLWPGDHPRYLSVAEEEAMLAIALQASSRLDVPFLAVDVAQLEGGEWIVMDVNDPQCCDLSQQPLIQFWQALTRCIDRP